ncbi:MAG: ribosome recycling factor [bacterium]|nr:ribosome recycling factor [bacterium]
MLDKILHDAKPKMDQAIEHLRDDLRTIRTGRATASLVDDVTVAYYGNSTPLKQVASITTPDSNLISIQPWDKNILGDIENAIRNANLGFNPINDGHQVRIVLPPLTEERRKEFAKSVNQKAEVTRILLRNIRKEAWDKVQAGQKVGELTEDDRYRGEDRLNRLIDDFNKEVDEIVKQKDKEIMTI